MSMQNKKYMPTSRRANQQVQEQIANILLFDISDPGLRMVTITGCDVSPDKRNAKIYYTTEKDKYKSVAESFSKAAGYMRKLLGDRLE